MITTKEGQLMKWNKFFKETKPRTKRMKHKKKGLDIDRIQNLDQKNSKKVKMVKVPGVD